MIDIKTEHILLGAIVALQLLWFMLSYRKSTRKQKVNTHVENDKEDNLRPANNQLNSILTDLQKSYVSLSNEKEGIEILNSELEERHEKFEYDVLKSKVKSDALLESNSLLSKRERNLRMQTVKLEEQLEILKDLNKQLQAQQIQLLDQTKNLNDQKNNLANSNEQLETREREITGENKLLDEKNKELGNLNQVLSNLNATKNKFFSIMAHDLRNPINGILGNSELMETNFDKLDDEKKRKLNHAIHDSSKRIASLLESLFQWSMSQSDTIEADLIKININQLINSVVQLVSSNLIRKNIRIDLQLTDFAEAIADQNMISTVLRNLTGNAIKYSKPESTIVFRTMRLEKTVNIMIEDHGIGMDEDQIAHLFDTDKQYQRPGTEGERGTGLGLIICNDFVAKNGSELKVTSTLGEGTTFSFELPISI